MADETTDAATDSGVDSVSRPVASTAAARPLGEGLVRLDIAGTVVFAVVVAVAAQYRDERPAQVLVAVVSLALFAIGVVLSLWAYAAALERSRIDEIGVANLYLLTGATAPRRVRRSLTASLVAQTAVALVGATIGLSGLEGNDLNALAFGVLVPMLGIGVNGAWAVRHGSFGPRLTGGTVGRRRGER